MATYQEEITDHVIRQTTQFEEIVKAPEPGMVRMLELSDYYQIRNLKQL